jgi:hypothetical protein
MPGELTALEVAGRVADIGARLLAELARVFPVCAMSDEFHYFPQVPVVGAGLYAWDDYSPATVARIGRQLQTWVEELEGLEKSSPDPETRQDIALLRRLARTLYGEFITVASWREQPSFHLTIASIGLAQALEAEDPEAWPRRLAGLPDFLDQAGRNLERLPALFRELGLEMVRDTQDWLRSLPPDKPAPASALAALDRFAEQVRRASSREGFRLEPEIFETVVRDHMGCGFGPAEAMDEIERELAEMEELMAAEAGRLAPGRPWREALDHIPLPALPADGLISMYRDEVRELGRHCRDLGLVSEDLFIGAPVRVEPVPAYLETVRGVGAYSVAPGHPPRGGVFYLLAEDVDSLMVAVLRRDAGMLAAHETFPGHHLLDAHRWGLPRPLRRCLEFPLFYEGWACFAEELMVHTGYFRDPWDRLRLARRHYWRAVRGKIDLALQTGDMDLQTAAAAFAATGMDPAHAAAIVRTYPLKPAYQVCYTIGARRFRGLFARGGLSPAAFAQKVFAAGEIEFEDLERVVKT